MASPRWCGPGDAPLVASIAAATHEAWMGPEEGASNRFLDAFRRLVGPERAVRHEMEALRLFQSEPHPPEGYDTPPSTTGFAMCPRCRTIRATPHTRPQRGRLKLQALRDRDWLAAQFERGENTVSIAKRLGCAVENVVYWSDKHGILTPKMAGAREIDAQVRALHQEERGPGGIARELETKVQNVRQSLARQGLATQKSGHVYHRPEWWVTRMREWGWTKTACAREAGIQPHAATYYVNRFGLSDLTRAAKKPVKYPVLADRFQLAALLKKHDDNYEKVAEEVGCCPSLVSRYARQLLGRKRKHSNQVPHGRREWWEERLARGMVAHEMAEEAGVAEKTARERLRVFGLSDEAYAIEFRRERQRRRA